MPIVLPKYIEVSDADDYFFNGRLNSEAWIHATPENKNSALVTATRAIDRLNFVGNKADDTQETEFPRNVTDGIPQDILIATCEEAIARLDGADPEFEMGTLNSVDNAYAGVRNTYDRSAPVEHIQAGIMSPIAWSHLISWLADPLELTLCRV